MKEKFPTFYKITKIQSWLFKNWTKIAEIIVVIWAINGMKKVVVPVGGGINWGAELTGQNPIIPLLFYFLSAVLILYLLRKYERKK